MLNRSKFLIGQYRPGKSFLHRLDARTKIFLVLMVMVSALVRTEPVFYLVLILVLMSLLLSCGLGVLLATYKRLANSGHTLVLKNMNGHIARIFNVSGLDKVFTIE